MSGLDLTSPRTLRTGLPALAELARALGLEAHFSGDAVLHGADPIIRSPHRLGEAAATAQLLIGIAAAAIREHRTRHTTDVAIDIVDALHFLHPTHYVQQNGYSMNVGAEHVAVNNTFQTADGRWVMLEAGPPYPKLLDGYLAFFDCGNTREAFAREVRKWNAEQLEDALAEHGLPVCIARTQQEWRSHPQGKILTDTPVIEITKIADGDPIPFTPNGRDGMPLDGIRSLDFTHVLAGPRSTRTLAEYGADVLHVSSPRHRDTIAQHLGVDIGKRNAYLDLTTSGDLGAMRKLAASADVFTTTYRPAVNRRYGLLAGHLAAENSRGIVYVTANAYGHIGPWAERPGFDQNGQVATGFALEEGDGSVPRFSPVFYLADLMTGYFAAAGAMAALLRRSTEGGSYEVKLSLARSTMWVQDLGSLDRDQQNNVPTTDEYSVQYNRFPTVYGEIGQLAPALRFSTMTTEPVTALSPYGSDPARW